MASPFSIFRKHQQVLMVVLVIMAMFAFTLDSLFSASGTNFLLLGLLFGSGLALVAGLRIGHPIEYAIGGAIIGAAVGFILPRAYGPQPVATSKLGAFTNERIEDLIQRRQAANHFISQAWSQTRDEDQQFGSPPVFGFGYQNIAQDVMLGEILRHEANEMGIHIDDEAVDDFIIDLTDDKIDGKLFTEINKNIAYRNKRLNEPVLYDLLRDGLKARMAVQMLVPYRVQQDKPTPDQYWNFFKRLNVQQELVTVALPVSAFVSETNAPSDEELKALFNKHKDVFPNQQEFGSPGFRQPRKMQIAWLEADYESTEASIGDFTDEEIRAYYEEHKDPMFLDTSLPEPPATTPEMDDKPTSDAATKAAKAAEMKAAAEKAAAEKKAGEKKAAELKAAEMKAAAMKAAEEKVAAEKKAAEMNAARKKAAAKKAAAKKATKKKADDQKAAEKNAAEEKAAETKEDEKKTEEKKPSDATAPAGAEKPAAEDSKADATDGDGNGTETEAPESESSPPPADEAETEPADNDEEFSSCDGPDESADESSEESTADSSDEKRPVNTPPANDGVGDEGPTADARSKSTESSAAEPSATDAQPEETKPAGAKPDSPATAAAPDNAKPSSGPPDVPDNPEKKFKPLDDGVKGDIRDRLLAERTRKSMEDRINAALLRMRKLSDEYVISSLGDESRDNLVARMADSLKRIGVELNLKYVESPLVSYADFSNREEYPISAATEPVENPFARQNPMSVADKLFTTPRSVTLFDPDQAVDLLQTDNRFAFWVTEEQASHVAEFTEAGVREQVLQSWREQQARPVAEARAKELSQLGRTAVADGKTLSDAFLNQTATGTEGGLALTVRTTPPFSWMRRNSAPPTDFASLNRPPELSPVIGVDGAGGKFMEYVFNELDNTEVGVVPNQDFTTYYIVQVTNRTPVTEAGIEDLRKRFLQTPLFGFFSPFPHMVQGDQQRVNGHWTEALEKKYDLSWTDFGDGPE